MCVLAGEVGVMHVWRYVHPCTCGGQKLTHQVSASITIYFFFEGFQDSFRKSHFKSINYTFSVELIDYLSSCGLEFLSRLVNELVHVVF